MDINELINKVNIAEDIDKEKLKVIGNDVVDNYNLDDQSRSGWLDNQKDYLKLATQVKDSRSFPWQNSSNIKYPLLSIASLQFQARSYQTLLPDTSVVKGRVVGEDATGEKANKASRISQYMSYQLLEEIPNWEEDMDILLYVLPIVGTVFKKTYHNGERPCIDLLMPENVVVNYYAKDLASAPRISEVIQLDPNEVIERMRNDEFLTDDDFTKPFVDVQKPNELLEYQGHLPPSNDNDGETPVEFIEQHCWLDLDDDGYKEPYVVVVHKETRKVARIAPRWRADKVQHNSRGEISKIVPTCYYECYKFIPNPVSGVYGIGFGSLLGPINEAVNSILNQLVDAGTLNNLPSGFMSKGIRLMGGNYRFAPGEFKAVASTGDDLKKGIYQFEFNPPNPVLFNLLGTLISSGQNLASVTETMMGEQPGQNTPFSTTQEILNQGLKVYASIMKRIHRSLKNELKKLYDLNKYYLPKEKYFTVLDYNAQAQGTNSQISIEDFKGDDTDVVPASDPSLASDVQKLRQSQVIHALVPFGTVNPVEATKRILEAERIPDIARLMEMPPPEPNFEQKIKMQELELQAKKQETDEKLNQFKVAAEAAKDEAEAMLKQAQAAQLGAAQEMEKIKGQFEIMKKEMEMKLQVLKTETELVKIESMQAKTAMQAQQAQTKKYNKDTKTIE